MSTDLSTAPILRDGHRAITDKLVKHWHLSADAATFTDTAEDATVRTICGKPFWPNRTAMKYEADPDLAKVTCQACAQTAAYRAADGRTAAAPEAVTDPARARPEAPDAPEVEGREPDRDGRRGQGHEGAAPPEGRPEGRGLQPGRGRRLTPPGPGPPAPGRRGRRSPTTTREPDARHDLLATCCHPTDSPYRRHDTAGQVFEGCVDAGHDGPTADAWHLRPAAHTIRSCR